MRATAYILPAIALVGAAVLSSVFIVDERERVLVLQFGQVKQVISEPGLGFKIPLIQEVVRYEDRILGLPTQPLEVTPLDDRRLVVDAFAARAVRRPHQPDEPDPQYCAARGCGAGGGCDRRAPDPHRSAGTEP